MCITSWNYVIYFLACLLSVLPTTTTTTRMPLVGGNPAPRTAPWHLAGSQDLSDKWMDKSCHWAPRSSRQNTKHTQSQLIRYLKFYFIVAKESNNNEMWNSMRNRYRVGVKQSKTQIPINKEMSKLWPVYIMGYYNRRERKEEREKYSQHRGWILSCWVKEARHKREDAEWLYLHKGQEQAKLCYYRITTVVLLGMEECID